MTSNEYWIVFKHSPHWTQFFLKKGYGHCYVIFKDDYNWKMVDPKTYGLDVQILSHSVTENVPRLLNMRGSSVICIRLQKSDRQHFKFLQFVTCVTLVKYILGIKVYALTPYQLYKKLRFKNNFKNITQSRVML